MQGKNLAIIVGVVVVAILLLGLLGGGMMAGPMMGWGGFGYGHGGYSFGWWGIAMGIVMLLFWALIIGGAIWLVVSLFRQGRAVGVSTGRSALDILSERYARGEITREQYEQMRRDLES